MAAGLGYIEFATGDILTAAAANGYLASQTVMVFASSAARASAITSPQEGMISFLKDTDTMQFYTGAAWSNVDTGASPLTTKGDLYTFSTTNARLGVGTNGQILVADSAEATGLKWAAPAAGGKVLQVITTSKTDVFTTTSTSFTDITGFSVSITPTSSSSRILILSSINYAIDISSGQAQMQLLRGGTAIAIGDAAGSRTRATAGGAPPNNDTQTNYAGMFIDSPATTSSTTYKFQARVSASTFCLNRNFNDTDAAYSPRTISTITVMEIGA